MHPQSFRTRYFNRPLACCALVSLLNACDSVSDINYGEITPDQISIELPQRIRNASAVDITAVTAVATVNGVEHTLIRNGGRFEASITVPSNSTVNVALLFTETLPSGAVINLARHPTVSTSVGTDNQTLEFFDDAYDTSSFDADGDGFSNIAERELGTDPLVFSNTATQRNIVVSFDLPADIPDPPVTQVIATFAGIPRAVRRTGNRFEVSGTVSTASEISIEVILLQQFNGQRVVLATARQSLGVGIDAETIPLSSGDFDFNEDTDGDGRNNADEIRAGTNPFIQD